MEKAFVIINAMIGSDKAVRDEIAKIKGVTKAELVYGIYDMVVTVEHENKEKLKDIVNEIRKVKDVRSTLTLIINP